MDMSITKKMPATGHDEPKESSFHSSLHYQHNQFGFEEEFRNAMIQSGIVCNETIVADGIIHRFSHQGKDGKDAWYIFFGMTGAFGDWSTNIHETWCAKSQSFNSGEKKKISRQIEIAKKASQDEKDRQNNETSFQAEKKWHSFVDTGISPYLVRKKVNSFGIRFCKGAIVIPLRDIGGKLWSLQFINDDGNKKFLKGGRKAGCFHVLGHVDNKTPQLFVTEGYSTGASVYMAMNIPTIIAFDAGNIDLVVSSFRQIYPNMQITIAADNDCWKDGVANIGLTKAQEAANKYGCSVIHPKFINTESKPTDFNDLHILEGIEVVQAQLQQIFKETPKPFLPFGFAMKKDGLYYDDKWICSPIEVFACTRDEHQKNWGRLVRFKDFDQHLHEIAIPMEIMKGDCSDLIGLLLSSGLRICASKTTRNKLAEFIQSINVEKRALCTSRIGWHANTFIMPHGSIPETDDIYLQSDYSNFAGFRSAGTLEEWQEQIAKYCKSNSRLMFAVSCAFAAPLLPILNVESGGVHIKGASSIGKSTTLAVAASVWGNPKFVQTWKTTGNALEAIAEAHNNTLLCLDELGQVDGKEAGEIAYMLANGSGKNRMKAKGGLRTKYEWNLLFLSTGEISVVDKIAESGKKAHAGMLARMVDIPADSNKGHGLFDILHDFKDGNTLAHHLKNKVANYYGTPILAYLAKLTSIKNDLHKFVEEIRKDFFLKYVPANSDGQVKRVAERFVIIASGGELAIKFGILPYELGESFAAVGICFQSWLEERGGITGYEDKEAIRQVQAFLESHHSSRFASMGDNGNTFGEPTINNQVGFKRKVKVSDSDSTEESWEFFVFPEIFRKEICKGFEHRTVCKALAEKGFLIRGNARQFVKECRLPIGRKKVYHLKHTIITDDDE
jgi:putative DNA primase/helicase